MVTYLLKIANFFDPSYLVPSVGVTFLNLLKTLQIRVAESSLT